MRTEVVYTFPFETTAALRAVAEIERMGDLDRLEAAVRADSGPEDKTYREEDADAATPLEQAQERIGELRQRRDELIATLPPVRQVRVLVRAVKYNDQTHYRVLYKDGMAWFTALTGREVDENLADDPEMVDLRNLAIFRAEMLCAIDRRQENRQTVYVCEHRSFAYGVEPLNGWQMGVLPSEWAQMETMGDELPVDLFEQWLMATRELNAGVLSTIPFFSRQRRASRNVIV